MGSFVGDGWEGRGLRETHSGQQTAMQSLACGQAAREGPGLPSSKAMGMGLERGGPSQWVVPREGTAKVMAELLQVWIYQQVSG